MLGRLDLKLSMERGAVNVDVDEILIHPDWNPLADYFHSNIAILTLSETVKFSNFIRPICLHPLNASRSIDGVSGSFVNY